MTEMVYGAAPMRVGDPVLPRWWRTIDKWTLSSVLLLFSIGLLLGLASSPPLAARNGLDPFHYVERQAFFGFVALGVMMVTSMSRRLSSTAARNPAAPLPTTRLSVV